MIKNKTLITAAIALLASALNSFGVSYGSGTRDYNTVPSIPRPTTYSTNYFPTTNDASGINAAINAAHAAGGGTVKLESRTYTLNAPITLKSKVRLVGNGPENTILRRGNSFSSSDKYFVGSSDAALRHVEVRDLKINGRQSRSTLKAEPTVLVGLRMYAAGASNYDKRWRVYNVEIKGFTIGIQASGSTEIRIENCDLHDNGGSSLHHNLYFRRTGKVLIYNCDVYDSVGGSGIKLAGGTQTVTDESRYFDIRKNRVFDNERINLNIQGCHHNRIEENLFNNQFATNDSRLGGIYLVKYAGYECRYTDIINNKIVDNNKNGIYVDGCRTFSIEGNAVLENGTNYMLRGVSEYDCDYNSSY